MNPMQRLELCQVVIFIEKGGYGFVKSIINPNNDFFFHISVFQRSHLHLLETSENNSNHHRVPLSLKVWINVEYNQPENRYKVDKVYSNLELSEPEVIQQIAQYLNKLIYKKHLILCLDNLPNSLFLSEELFLNLRSSIKFIVLVYIYKELGETENFSKLLKIAGNSDIADVNNHLKLLPLRIKSNPYLIPILHPHEQTEALLTKVHTSDLSQDLINQISNTLNNLKPEDKQVFLNKLPSNIQVKPVILSHFSLERQGQIIFQVFSLESIPESYFSIVKNLIESLPDQQFDLFKLLPKSIQDNRLESLNNISRIRVMAEELDEANKIEDFIIKASVIIRQMSDTERDKCIRFMRPSWLLEDQIFSAFNPLTQAKIIIQHLSENQITIQWIEIINSLLQRFKSYTQLFYKLPSERQPESFHLLDQSAQSQIIRSLTKVDKISLSKEWYPHIEEHLKQHDKDLEVFQLLPQSYQDQYDYIDLLSKECKINLLRKIVSNNIKLSRGWDKHIQALLQDKSSDVLVFELLPKTDQDRDEYFELLSSRGRLQAIKNLYSKNLNLSEIWCSRIKVLLLDYPDDLELFQLLPQAHQEQDKYFKLLSNRCQLKVIKQSCSGKQNVPEIWHRRIQRLLSSYPDDLELFQLLPQAYQEQDEYFELLSSRCQLRVIKQLFSDNQDLPEIWCRRIQRLLPSYPDDLELFQLLPQVHQEQDEYFSLLNKYSKIEITYRDFKQSMSKTWGLLTVHEKILCVFKIAKYTSAEVVKNTVLPTLRESHAHQEENSLIFALLQLLRCRFDNDYRKSIGFDAIDKKIVKYICSQANQALSTSEHVNLGNLLPKCAMGLLDYCEAKILREDKAWCTRLGCTCSTSQPQAPITKQNPYIDLQQHYSVFGDKQGAVITADINKDWQQWTLVELIYASGLLPETSTNNETSEIDGFQFERSLNNYIRKLASWINKINEIKHRMRCRYCSSIMPHDIEYSKHSVRFNVTVFHCPHTDSEPYLPHDKDIYINECWGCKNIIDSRESRIQQWYLGRAYYVCIHCSSGHTQLIPGQICPSCGHDYSSLPSRPNTMKECPNCHHKIKLPSPWIMERFQHEVE